MALVTICQNTGRILTDGYLLLTDGGLLREEISRWHGRGEKLDAGYAEPVESERVLAMDRSTEEILVFGIRQRQCF